MPLHGPFCSHARELIARSSLGHQDTRAAEAATAKGFALCSLAAHVIMHLMGGRNRHGEALHRAGNVAALGSWIPWTPAAPKGEAASPCRNVAAPVITSAVG